MSSADTQAKASGRRQFRRPLLLRLALGSLIFTAGLLSWAGVLTRVFNLDLIVCYFGPPPELSFLEQYNWTLVIPFWTPILIAALPALFFTLKAVRFVHAASIFAIAPWLGYINIRLLYLLSSPWDGERIISTWTCVMSAFVLWFTLSWTWSRRLKIA